MVITARSLGSIPIRLFRGTSVSSRTDVSDAQGRLLNVAEARLALSSPILGWEVAFYMGIGAGRMSDESGRQPIRHIPDKNIMCMIQSFVSVELGGSRCSRARHLANSLWQMRSGNCAR